jgi:hypothetical protein
LQINSGAQKYSEIEGEVNQRVSDEQSQIEDLKGKSHRHKSAPLSQQQQALEGKLALDKATLQAIQKRRASLNHRFGGHRLEASINDLAVRYSRYSEKQCYARCSNRHH